MSNELSRVCKHAQSLADAWEAGRKDDVRRAFERLPRFQAMRLALHLHFQLACRDKQALCQFGGCSADEFEDAVFDWADAEAPE